VHQQSVYLETFGCQMNELDSELVQGQLEALGYRFTEDDLEADIVLYNTCSVREQAENKALSRVGIISQRKRDGAPPPPDRPDVRPQPAESAADAA
jgi:tRNA-2-methylthio-N6-dimethylallyladenosine synthase